MCVCSFLLRKEAVGEWRGKSRRANGCQTDGKEICIKRGNGKFFLLFLFPSVPPFGGGGGLSRERRLAAHPKKAFDEKESTCTKALHIPPRSRAQFALCVSPCVETTTSHGPKRWTNQSVVNISKSPFSPSTPAKIKKGYIQALDFSKSPLFNCHVFCPPLDSFSSSRFSPLKR